MKNKNTEPLKLEEEEDEHDSEGDQRDLLYIHVSLLAFPTLT